jgi:uncharacterized protein YdiU (UPF0061 family)
MSSGQTSDNQKEANPFLSLNYEPAFESLGEDFYTPVRPATFPQHILRFRNDEVLSLLGLDAKTVSDRHFVEFFGQFQGKQPCLALCYHGYQFGQYNPYLGDGRGFLYGQVRGVNRELYDFGTKGSGQTPYSQSRDGRLSLEGGVREVLAAEALHSLGVRTSRCVSLIETGECLRRDNESSSTRSSVLVRLSRSHIRFGTFERLEYYDRPEPIQTLLNHAIAYYYPTLWGQPEQYIRFYAELVKRVAELVAQWMAVGFCHGVLNTDNMSITGESFDYGPYAFIDTYNPNFTAASFDRWGRYSYRNQPSICRWNLEMLQRPLSAVIPVAEMEAILETFPELYTKAYYQRMLNKLGFEDLPPSEAEELINLTLQFLLLSRMGYHQFFSELRQQFSSQWREDETCIFPDFKFLPSAEPTTILQSWRRLYHRLLSNRPITEIERISQRLRQHNPIKVLLQPELEAVWQPIADADNWNPFKEFIRSIQSH